MKRLSKNLTFWVLIFGIFGYLSASLFGDSSWVNSENPPEFYNLILMVKSIFLQMLKMMIAPLIFFSLIGGLINIGGAKKLKKMGSVAIIYYISTTIIAILIGLSAVFFVHPWKNSNVTMEVKKSKEMNYIQPKKFIDAKADSLSLVLHKLLKKSFVNPFNALAKNNILGIVTSALLIGLAMIFVLPQGSVLVDLVGQINSILNKILSWVILTSPFGIFAIVFDFKLKVSGDIFSQLLSFSLLVFGATMIHGLIVLPIIAKFFGGVSPLTLFKKISRPLLIALGTASSSATLPVTMKTCEEELGVSRGVSGFVFPLGATMNMDGTALFEGIAAIFLAHLYGIELGTVSMIAIFFMSMISSIGAPGMPSGSMSGMQMVLLAAGIPLEAIGILMVVERPLDTFRTAVNVEGDIIGALVVQNRLNKSGAL